MDFHLLHSFIRLIFLAVSSFYLGMFVHLTKKSSALKYLIFFLILALINYSVGIEPLQKHIFVKKLDFFLYTSTALLYMPQVFLYVKNINTPKPLSSYKNYLHYIIALPFMILAIPIFSIKIKDPQLLDDFINGIYAQKTPYFKTLYFILIKIVIMVQISYYLIRIFLIKRKYHKSIKDVFSEVSHRNLRWIDSLVISIAILTLIFNITDHYFTLTTHQLGFMQGVLLLYMVVFIGFHGKNQIEPYLISNENIGKISETKEPEKTASKYKTEPLDENERKRLIKELEKVMQRDAIYLKPDLQLGEVACLLNTSKNKVSQILNEDMGMNFYNYINKLRIEAACKMFQSEKSNTLTVEGIARQAGFKSKVSFNQHFKTITGMNPSEYRKGQDTLRPLNNI